MRDGAQEGLWFPAGSGLTWCPSLSLSASARDIWSPLHPCGYCRWLGQSTPVPLPDPAGLCWEAHPEAGVSGRPCQAPVPRCSLADMDSALGRRSPTYSPQPRSLLWVLLLTGVSGELGDIWGGREPERPALGCPGVAGPGVAGCRTGNQHGAEADGSQS